MNKLIALLSGIIFGLGLSISGMTDRSKVLGFLDIFGAWDATLMFVMGGALCVAVPGFYFASKRHKPVLSDKFNAPSNTIIDKPLIIGAVIFGLGWGLYGYCPGPALASLAYLDSANLIFVFFMLVGIFSAGKISR